MNPPQKICCDQFVIVMGYCASTKACFKIHHWPAFSLRSQLRATTEEIEASSYQLLARVLGHDVLI